MKFTIELEKEDLSPSILALLSALAGVPQIATNVVKEPVTGPAFDPDSRVYGVNGEKARRTKQEIAEDAEIEERWRVLWPSKPVPAKPVGELKEIIGRVEGSVPKEDEPIEEPTPAPVDEEPEFDVGGDSEADDVEKPAEPMDLDEFRALLMRAMKALGGKVVAPIMAPHKSATDVPEEERNAYAEKVHAALVRAAS